MFYISRNKETDLSHRIAHNQKPTPAHQSIQQTGNSYETDSTIQPPPPIRQSIPLLGNLRSTSNSSTGSNGSFVDNTTTTTTICELSSNITGPDITITSGEQQISKSVNHSHCSGNGLVTANLFGSSPPLAVHAQSHQIMLQTSRYHPVSIVPSPVTNIPIQLNNMPSEQISAKQTTPSPPQNSPVVFGELVILG